MRKFFKQFLLPGSTYAALCLSVAVLSYVGLFYHIFDVGISPTLITIINRYDELLNQTLGRMVPYLKKLARHLHWDINLYSHWKHILVLLGLYFFSGARAEIAEFFAGRHSNVIFRLTMGFAVALLTSIMVGQLPLDNTDKRQNYLIAAIPLLMISGNDLLLRAWRGWFSRVYEANRLGKPITTCWVYFKEAAYPITVRTVVGLVIIFSGLTVGPVSTSKLPGLVLLGLIVGLLASYQICLGATEFKHLRTANEHWIDTAKRSRGLVIGIDMFKTMFWSVVTLGLGIGGEIFGF